MGCNFEIIGGFLKYIMSLIFGEFSLAVKEPLKEWEEMIQSLSSRPLFTHFLNRNLSLKLKALAWTSSELVD